MLEGVLVPVSTYSYPPGYQTISVRDLPEEVHTVVPPPTAYPDAHRR
ncbi:unnamed protein product [Larinioides sclopetarius]|uniref:Uncharacterized protein n=1 Tax=Larinioides sclopetarius TaxID=280406 RepID=A0AAV1ZEX1_9ARAC